MATIPGRTETAPDIRAMASGLVQSSVSDSMLGRFYQIENMRYALKCLLNDTEPVATKVIRTFSFQGRQFREVTIDNSIKFLYVLIDGEWNDVVGYLPEED